MSSKLNISEDVLNKLIINIFNITSDNNGNHIKNILLNSLPDHSKETILHLACVGSDYTTVYPGDYVKVKPPSYHAGTEFEWDVMADMKLDAGNGFVFGKVIGDGSYRSDYNPFYASIKVELMYHDADRSLKNVEHGFTPTDLIKVKEDDIEYFDIIHELDG
tara:strand:- start:6723 stop:7208 length:486 start_codon:yes stop_codon:yes gene_type:complete